MTTLTLALAALTLAGTPASAETVSPSGGVGTQVAGCPGFPGFPAGGVCLYEPVSTPGLEPRYGSFHSYARSAGSTFSVPYLVGFIDVNSTATQTSTCGVNFYDITFPGGVWTKTWVLTIQDWTNNGFGGYVVPSSLVARIDRGEFVC